MIQSSDYRQPSLCLQMAYIHRLNVYILQLIMPVLILQYDHPKVINSLIFPRELGFVLTFSDQMGGSYQHFLSNSSARSHDFTQMKKIEEFELISVTDEISVTVAVVTEAGNFSSSPFKFSGSLHVCMYIILCG